MGIDITHACTWTRRPCVDPLHPREGRVLISASLTPVVGGTLGLQRPHRHPPLRRIRTPNAGSSRSRAGCRCCRRRCSWGPSRTPSTCVERKERRGVSVDPLHPREGRVLISASLTPVVGFTPGLQRPHRHPPLRRTRTSPSEPRSRAGCRYRRRRCSRCPPSSTTARATRPTPPPQATQRSCRQCRALEHAQRVSTTPKPRRGRP